MDQKLAAFLSVTEQVIGLLNASVVASTTVEVSNAEGLESEHLLQLRMAQMEFARYVFDGVRKDIKEATSEVCQAEVRLSQLRLDRTRLENERVRLDNDRVRAQRWR